jgi:hypothetical protein
MDEALTINNEVIRMITSTISAIRANQGAKRVRDDKADYMTDTDLISND